MAQTGPSAPSQLPYCFVAMPFGKKSDVGGSVVDFDVVYEKLIKPAVEAAGLEPIRADEEQAGGIIHKPMFERLVLCPVTVADLTTANANVFYELGVRHALRPHTTVLMFAQGARLPFDVASLRAVPYELGAGGGPGNVDRDRAALQKMLEGAKQGNADSPVFQLLDGMTPPDIARLKTDVFRDRVAYSSQLKSELAKARKAGADAVRELEKKIAAKFGGVENVELGVVVDLLLSYRATKAWKDMQALVLKMARAVADTVLVQEQLAFALNRMGERDEAQRVLYAVLNRAGPSSETYGLLGRVYKDQWDDALKAGDELEARGHLDRAIAAYLNGFEADWRDAYPGINATTLMELREPPDPRRTELLVLVRYAAKRRVASGKADYWDHATLLEANVLAEDRAEAQNALGAALAIVREKWEPETTARNLRLIRETWTKRGKDTKWLEAIEAALNKRAS